MDYLFDGVKKFSTEDFNNHQDLFKQNARSQKPHSLFIGCSDSRVVPNLITKTLPGDIFVIRNIANMVPPFKESDSVEERESWSTASAIEYALKVLEVKNVIVCGHSNCGGCHALFMDDAKAQKVPYTKKWLEIGKPVKEKILAAGIQDEREREWKTEQLNVVEQMNNLLTYPEVKERYSKGQLQILGWHYNIETGEVSNYDKESKSFKKIE